MEARTLSTGCCIVGGGPAGMMLGYLLARHGIQVTVLEKHKDFLRDFRGDTVHPSTLELFHELDLLDEFLKLPHQKVEYVSLVIGRQTLCIADFRHAPAQARFVALMPQWDFLDFLADRAREYPNFELRMKHHAVGVTRERNRIAGVRVKAPGGTLQIKANLTIACDGRHSEIRKAAGLEVVEFGVPIDVLWFRLPRASGDPEQLLGNINYGRALVLINRESYFQAGLIIKKGSFDEMRARGLEEFRATVRTIAPYLGERVQELRTWDQVKLLTVRLNRLKKWHRPGLLCIGDAAHAMSPAGGVGINLAIQDAVAAANCLANPLLRQTVDDAQLAKVQRRRELPTRVTQFLQMNAHKGFARIFENRGELEPPWLLKAAIRVPGFQRAVGRLVGMGLRPEHITGRQTIAAPRSVGARAAAAVGLVAGFLLFRRLRRMT